MAKFRVFVTETVNMEVTVDADDQYSALEVVSELWPEDFDVTGKTLTIDNVVAEEVQNV